MNLLKTLNKFTYQFESALLFLSIIACVVIIFFNVITRYFFNYSWAPMEEVVRFIRIWVTFFGASYAARKGQHITMSMIFDMLPEIGKKIIIIIISASTSFVCFFIAFSGYQLAMVALKNYQVSPALRWPLAPIYMALPLSCLLMGIHYARNVVKNIVETGVYLGPEERKDIEKMDVD